MILINTLISAFTIGVCTWVAKKRPDLAGFIISLPLSTLLVLFLTQFQYHNDEKSIMLAKSIAVAIPSTLLFFIPFILSGYLKLNFWTCYASGTSLLVISYFIHKTVLKFI